MRHVPLHLTKVAFACASVDMLAERIATRATEGGMSMNTRFLPKRHPELVGGSLYWILKHQLVARTPITGFGEAEGGRTLIHLEPVLVLITPCAKRAHQGWRYLEHEHAPADLGGGGAGSDPLPPRLASELSALALI